jgi:hypothetical protein
MNKLKKHIALVLVLLMVFSIFPIQHAFADEENPILTIGKKLMESLAKGDEYLKELVSKFKDMENNWAKLTVGTLIDLGIIDGYSDGTFKPNNTITRSEFTKLVRTAMKYELVIGNTFKDTTTNWAKNEIHTVVVNGGIDKVEFGENFYPNKNITRIEMAKMIVRSLGLDAKAKAKAGNTTQFTDDNQIGSADKGYIIIASENKIINGYLDKSFKPNGEATRAEASQMIVNMLNYIKNGSGDVTQPTPTPIPVPSNTLSENLTNSKVFSIETFKIENGKAYVKNIDATDEFVVPKTSALASINEVAIGIANAMAKKPVGTEYIKAFHYKSDYAPKIVFSLRETSNMQYDIFSITLAEKLVDGTEMDGRLSSKIMGSLWIGDIPKENYASSKQKIQDSLIAIYGETDGKNLAVYVMQKYDEKNTPERIKAGYQIYANKIESKTFGKARVDWYNDPFTPDSTSQFFFTKLN